MPKDFKPQRQLNRRLTPTARAVGTYAAPAQAEKKMVMAVGNAVSDILRDPYGDKESRIDSIFTGPDGFKQVGLSGTKFNTAVINELQTSATSYANNGQPEVARDILNTINKIPTGTGFLGNTAAGRKFKTDTGVLITRIENNRDAVEFSKTSCVGN